MSINLISFSEQEIEVMAELLSDAAAYLPDPEDQPEPGSFADIVIKLNQKMQQKEQLCCERNYCDANS